MKKGNLIINNNICQIIFENPTIKLEEKLNKDGTKSLIGYKKWLPLKFSIESKNGHNFINGEVDEVLIVENDKPNAFKLKECNLDLKKQIINFKNCISII